MTVSGRLLLISNSTQHGSGYLDHVAKEIIALLGSAKRVAFVPHAMHDRDGYAARARARFEAMGYALHSVHEPGASLDGADAWFVGGGNTFRLLDAMQRLELIAAIRSGVARGIPYIGSSAGSIVAGPSLRTTKDMPIVQPRSFEALGLVPFQISPHYLDPDPGSTHMGETQEERILQFHEENDAPVVGLREGSMLLVDAGRIVLRGHAGARIFRKGRPPVEAEPGGHLEQLVA